MNEPSGIIVFGANGSGKTTLGRELARVLGCKHIDHEDYAFNESEVPYSDPRTVEECRKLMLIDIKQHHEFVLSAVTGDFGEAIEKHYLLAVYIEAPLELRLERVNSRAVKQHGVRVLEVGDMHEQQLRFSDFVAKRPLSRIEQWSKTLKCPVIRVDGATDWRVSAAEIAIVYKDLLTKPEENYVD